MVSPGILFFVPALIRLVRPAERVGSGSVATPSLGTIDAAELVNVEAEAALAGG
jgi:hypothetical protein